MNAPNILIINRNTLRKKGKEALTFFDIKDVNIDIEKMDKVEMKK